MSTWEDTNKLEPSKSQDAKVCSSKSPLLPATTKWVFKEDCSLEHRCVESMKIIAKYPNLVQVIVENVSSFRIVDIDKRKSLVPSDITVA